MEYLWNDEDKISAILKNNHPKALLMDFDGTLAPIVKFPARANLSSKISLLLQKLSKKPSLYLAIISGRKLSDLKEKINIPNIIYGGNHGMEGEIFNEKSSFPIPNKSLVSLGKIQQQLTKTMSKFSGVLIEDKGLTLSFHYRLANKQEVATIKLLFRKTIKFYVKSKLVIILPGKKVFDILPKVDWNKGYFATLVIRKITSKNSLPPSAIVIGDDKTDEDIFQKLKNEITIVVGKRRKSAARYYVKNQSEVAKLLDWINTTL